MGVAECLLNVGEVGTVAEQVRRIAVLQKMWPEAVDINASQFDAAPEEAVDLLAPSSVIPCGW